MLVAGPQTHDLSSLYCYTLWSQKHGSKLHQGEKRQVSPPRKRATSKRNEVNLKQRVFVPNHVLTGRMSLCCPSKLLIQSGVPC